MTAALSYEWLHSSRQNPCPICGRTKDGDCRMLSDGQGVICHHPKDLAPGRDVVNGWAFTRNTDDDRGGLFKPHDPRRNGLSARVLPFAPAARAQASSSSPKPAPITGPIELARCQPVDFDPANHSWRYSSIQGTKRVDDPKGKSFVPHHLIEQEWQRGAGPDPWPAYREADAIKAAGGWVLEAEGEKCADIIRAGGRVAISQPGHAHKVVQTQDRYQRLVDAGVVGIVYLEDNDEEGRKRSQQSKDAAAAVGLPLLVLPATEVWPGLPEKGSIDDAPGSAAEKVADLEMAITEALQRHQQERTRESLTLDEVKERLEQEINDGTEGSALALLTAELAAAIGQPFSTVKALAESLRIEQLQAAGVQAEAAALAAEADRQEIGQMLTASYLLPSCLAQAIEALTRYLPVDGPSAVLPYLAAVAGLMKLGAEVEATAVASYRVPINLYGCLVGRSGSKKSPVLKMLVDAPTQQLQSDLTNANKQAHYEWEEACRGVKKGEAPLAPRPKRLRCSDFTGEALADQLQTQEAHGLGLLVYRDELSGLFASFDQYKGGKGADEQQLLELFDGGGLSSLRITGGRHYSRSQVSIFGGTQPAVLKKLVANGDVSGLWARFLFAPLPERPVALPLRATPEEAAQVEAAEKTLANACRAVYQMPPRRYRLSLAAAERFASYELGRQHAAIGTTIGAQSALYGKSAGKVLRVAGVLHLLQITAGEISGQEEIQPDAVDRAAALVDHLDAWALSLHAGVAAGGVCDLMRTVHRRSEQRSQEVGYREVRDGLSERQRLKVSSTAVAAAMRALDSQGYGEAVEGPRGGVRYRAAKQLP